MYRYNISFCTNCRIYENQFVPADTQVCLTVEVTRVQAHSINLLLSVMTDSTDHIGVYFIFKFLSLIPNSNSVDLSRSTPMYKVKPVAKWFAVQQPQVANNTIYQMLSMLNSPSWLKVIVSPKSAYWMMFTRHIHIL